MKYYAKVIRKSTNTETTGTGNGRGFYEYANLRNFKRYVLNREGTALNHAIYVDCQYYVEVYEVYGSVYDESTHKLRATFGKEV